MNEETNKKSVSQSRSKRTKRGSTSSRKRNFKSKDEKFDYRNDSTNDISWYASDANLLRDSSSINFSWPTGSDVYGNVTTPTGDTATPYLTRVPGVCALRIKPNFGNVTDEGPIDLINPITTASKRLYSFVRHANSGHSNYDAPDLMLYVLAMGDIYSYVVWCQRLYAYALMYDARNKYMPRSLITTNQVDPDDLLANLSSFRYWLNSFISKVSAFAVPATLSYFSRKAFLYKNVYIEGESIKDQMYQLVPGAFLKFSIDGTTSKGQLEYANLPTTASTLMKISEVENFGELLFKALWDQEDFGIMSGDILKAYGDNIIKLGPVDTFVPIAPIRDEVVLHQFKNATVLPTAHVTSTFNALKQSDNGTLYGGLSLLANNTTSFTIPTQNILTTTLADATPEVVMESTRLMLIPKTVQNEQYACGTEVVVSVLYAVNPADDTTPYLLCDNFVTADFNNPTHLKGLLAQSQFDYAPKYTMSRTVENQQTGDISIQYGVFFDIDNYAILNYNDLRKVHEAALLNMLDVPSVAKI